MQVAAAVGGDSTVDLSDTALKLFFQFGELLPKRLPEKTQSRKTPVFRRAPKSRGPVSAALGRTARRIPRKINRLKGTVADLPRL